MALQWAVFFIAAVLVVIGTSLLWAAEDASLKSATDRAYRFTIFEFWLATFASAAALLSATAGWFPLKNTGVWIAIAAGTLFILVSSRGDISSTSQNGSIAIINNCRYTNEDTSTFNSKRCVGGGVLAYIGVFLAFIAGLPWAKPVFSGSRFVLLIAEFILLVIGVVVIWETDAAIVGASGYKLVVDDGFYSILVFFFAFLGVVLQINDLVVAAAFFAAYNYCRVFTSMFFVATAYPSQEDNVYAGYVILTFSNVFALIVALLGDSAGKSSKVGSNN